MKKSPCQRGFFEMHPFSGITGFLAPPAAVPLPAAILFPLPIHSPFSLLFSLLGYPLTYIQH